MTSFGYFTLNFHLFERSASHKLHPFDLAQINICRRLFRCAPVRPGCGCVIRDRGDFGRISQQVTRRAFLQQPRLTNETVKRYLTPIR